MLPFFYMAIPTRDGYEITVSATTANLYEDFTDPAAQAAVEGLFEFNDISEGFVQNAIKNVSNRFDRLYTKAASIDGGLPYGTMTTYAMDYAFIEQRLNSAESDPWTIEKLVLEAPQDEYYINQYLYLSHGYNRYTQTVNSMPATTPDTMDGVITFEVAEFRQYIDDQLTAMVPQIPLSRTEEEDVTVEGQPATLVHEITVSQDRAVTVIPNNTRRAEYTGKTLDIISDRRKRYTLNFEGIMELRLRGSGMLSYQESVKSYHRFGDGSTGSPTYEVRDRVELPTGLNKRDQTFRYPYSDTYIPDYVTGTPFYYVEYYTQAVGSSTRVPKLFMVRDVFQELRDEQRDNPDSSVDITEESYEAIDQRYYPIIRIRKYGNDEFGANPDDAVRAGYAREMLQCLDINADDLADGINENPDIDQIDEAYVIFGVPIDTEDPAGNRYLAELFYDAWTKLPAEYRVDMTNQAIPESAGQVRGVVSIESWDLRLKLYHTGIGVKTKQGRIGKLGSVTKNVKLAAKGDVRKDRLELRYQVDHNTYHEILVFNLFHVSVVYRDGDIRTRLTDVFGAGKDDTKAPNFIIPLRQDLVNKLPALQRQSLFYISAKIVFNAYEKRELEFYETDAFKATLAIATIAFVMMSGFDFYAQASAAFKSGTTKGLTYVATAVLKQYVYSAGFKYAVKVLGVEIAAIAALAATLAATYGKLGNVNSILSMSPDELMDLSVNVTKSIASNIEDELHSLADDFDEFQEEARSLMSQLQDIEESLEGSDLINPMYFTDVLSVDVGPETLDDFIERSLRTNIAPLSYGLVEHYVDSSLTLPPN